MNTKTITLPSIKLPIHASLAIYLLQEEIRNRSLTINLEKVGFDTAMYCSDLGPLILSLAGFKKRTDELVNWYAERLDHYAAKTDNEDTSLHELAFEFFVDIVVERRKTIQ